MWFSVNLVIVDESPLSLGGYTGKHPLESVSGDTDRFVVPEFRGPGKVAHQALVHHVVNIPLLQEDVYGTVVLID